MFPNLVIVLWRNNFKFIPRIEEYQRSHSCSSCTIADTKQSSGDSGCTLVLLSFSNVLQRISIQCLPNSSELAIALGFYSSAMIGVIKTTFDTILKLPVFQLLMIFRISIVAYNEPHTPNFFLHLLPYCSSSSPNKSLFQLYSSS